MFYAMLSIVMLELGHLLAQERWLSVAFEDCCYDQKYRGPRTNRMSLEHKLRAHSNNNVSIANARAGGYIT
jgi:hypothetical protein